MRILPLTMCAMLALAACGKNDPGEVKLENASVEQVAEATKAAEAAFNPGQWRTTTDILSLDVPGMPKEVAEQMGAAMGKSTSVEYCMTPEEAKKPRDAFARDNGECVFENFSMDGGKLNATMKCKPKDRPGEMALTMTGAYGTESYETTADMKVTGAGQDMTMKIKQKGERIGDCKA